MAFLKKRMPVLAAVCVFVPAAMGAQEARDGEALLRAMHDRYHNKTTGTKL